MPSDGDRGERSEQTRRFVQRPAAARRARRALGSRRPPARSASSAPSAGPYRAQRRRPVERASTDAPRASAPAAVERNVDVQTSEPVRVRRVERHAGWSSRVQQVGRIERRRDDSNDSLAGAIQDAGREETARDRGVIAVDRDRDGDRDGDRRWRWPPRPRWRPSRWPPRRRSSLGRRPRWHHRWSSDWRRDHRYDWRSYRSRYSSLFRLGRYYDPYRLWLSPLLDRLQPVAELLWLELSG